MSPDSEATKLAVLTEQVQTLRREHDDYKKVVEQFGQMLVDQVRQGAKIAELERDVVELRQDQDERRHERTNNRRYLWSTAISVFMAILALAGLLFTYLQLAGG